MARSILRKLLGLKDPQPRSLPLFDCKLRVLGSEYGGYAVCPTAILPDSVVYSFGVGHDVSFDTSLIDQFGVSVHAFDPTPSSIAWLQQQKLPASFVFHGWGIASMDGTCEFFPPEDPTHVSHTLVPASKSKRPGIEVPVFRLTSILERLGHHRVDVLKMDIEGAEYDVLPDILSTHVEIGQILIEFHHHRKGISLRDTQRAIDAIEAAGFRAFHRSADGFEFSFIRPESVGSGSTAADEDR